MGSQILKTICSRPVATVSVQGTVLDAAKQMLKHHVGCLVVTDQVNGRVIPQGMVTDRDITLALASNEVSVVNLPVRNIMMRHPVTADIGDGVEETLRKMGDRGIKRMPVLDESGGLYGVVSSDDLTMVLAREVESLAKISNHRLRRERGVHLPSPPPTGYNFKF